MKGKTVLITGGTSGIGQALAAALAEKGASILIVSRDEEKCRSVAEDIKTQTGNPNLSYIPADLSSQAEIRKLSEKVNHELDRLDVLINNAGGIFWQREESVDGIEMTFALNHLAYFLLTNLLLDKMLVNPGARIINTSSGSHHNQILELDNLELKENYFHFRAYGRTKLANLYFTFELARRLDKKAITVNAFNPGFVKTNIGRGTRFGKFLLSLGNLIAIPIEEGAKTGVYLASSRDVEGVTGEYFYQERIVPSSEISRDPEIAKELWQISQRLTGLA
jgi:NAD(P)-dependent dehydrogenase (short-subunit alcohol dehydrogenase family)